MSSVRLVRLKTGDKHDVQHGVVRLKADSSIFPERVGVTPNCSVGLRVSGTKTGKNPERAAFCFSLLFCTLRKGGHKLCFIYSSLLVHCSVRKEWNWMFCRATPLHEQFPALPTRPCHFTHKQDNLFLRCIHSCLFVLHVIFFSCVLNQTLPRSPSFLHPTIILVFHIHPRLST